MNNINTKFYPQYNFKFDGIKDTYDKYELKKDANGDLVTIEKQTNKIYNDQLMIDRVKFAVSWVDSVGLSLGLTKDQENIRYHYAFMEKSRESYAQIMTMINEQLKTTGNINTLEIFDNLYHKYRNAYAQEIASKLFNEKKYLNAIDKWARYAIPDALPPTHQPLTIEELYQYNTSRKL